ncbi:MAG: type II toxin-antitoxin system VapC family toxin [Acidobacteria bacterium]|nr:type II toxin-antitoxin system VapC family toxin [Acidobacteriota bacterium]
MLLDSNIIIYSVQPENHLLREFVEGLTPSISAISRAEVLGYRGLPPGVENDFNQLFAMATVLAVDHDVLSEAIGLRKQRKLGLGDSIIAGTALVHSLPLVTRNTKDFKWIDSITLIDPFELG